MINPPVKPIITPNPPRKPAKTGSPIAPSITYVNVERSACFGGSKAPVKKIARREKVKGIGWIGIDICDNTTINAVKSADIVNEVAFDFDIEKSSLKVYRRIIAY
jgi:hypothetical protein